MTIIHYLRDTAVYSILPAIFRHFVRHFIDLHLFMRSSFACLSLCYVFLQSAADFFFDAAFSPSLRVFIHFMVHFSVAGGSRARNGAAPRRAMQNHTRSQHHHPRATSAPAAISLRETQRCVTITVIPTR